MEIKTAGALVASAGLLTACNGGSQSVVAQPSNITLAQALVDTVDAMAAARAEDQGILKNGFPTVVPSKEKGGKPETQYVRVPAIGVNPCTITVQFNIAASGTSAVGQQVTLAAAGKVVPVSGGVTLSNTNSTSANRGNQVTVAFVSPACNPSGTLGTSSPSSVTLLERENEAARDGDRDPVYWKPGYQVISGGGAAAGAPTPPAGGAPTPPTPGAPTPPAAGVPATRGPAGLMGDLGQLNTEAPWRAPGAAEQGHFPPYFEQQVR